MTSPPITSRELTIVMHVITSMQDPIGHWNSWEAIMLYLIPLAAKMALEKMPGYVVIVVIIHG